MKRENISAYLKGKNFYLSLLVGICAVIAIVSIYLNASSNKENNLVDLNEPITKTASEEKVKKPTQEVLTPPVVSNVAENTVKQEDKSVLQQNLNDSLLENDIVSDPDQNIVEKPAEEVVDTSTVTVMNPKNTSNLKFDEEAGLLWPINGDVIMDYSMENAIYFETLAQYKCNPAIVISGEVGTDVLSAAKGVVTEISENEETGLTLSMSIGNEYSLVYGQLKDCTLEVGDAVAEGDIIGKISKPTKYYVVEGSNLFFQVMEKNQPVNPMLLLR